MKQRNIRKRRALDEQEALSDREEEVAEGQPPKLTAEDIKLLQKQRQRRTGVDASSLMSAEVRVERKEAGAAAVVEDVLHAAFKRERRLHSEEDDKHMKQYVEEQLVKRMGRPGQEEEEAAAAAEAERRARMLDPLLAAMPEGLQKRQQDTELGPSWVAGITEVPLSMDQKLANIEATEAAKKQLLAAAPIDDDDDYSGQQGGGARRGQYPVSFGRQDPKLLRVVAESQAKRARLRVVQEEKRQRKKEEFAGW